MSKEALAYICSHVFANERSVLLVSREDGDWQFLCGDVHEAGERPRVVGMNHLLERDHSLTELLDLPPEWDAERSVQGGPWKRVPANRDQDNGGSDTRQTGPERGPDEHLPDTAIGASTADRVSDSPWTPITRADFDALIDRECGQLSARNHAWFDAHSTGVTEATILRSALYGPERVFVVARIGDAVLYYDDVEHGFNVSRISADGVLLTPQCNQWGLDDAITSWREVREPGRGDTPG